MVVKDRREIPLSPGLLKFGVALALSLGGILYTIFRNKRNKPPKSQPSPGNVTKVDLRGKIGKLNSEDRALQDSSTPKISSPNSVSDISSSGRYSVDRDGFLLPEFDELVKECDMAVMTDDISPRRNREFPVPDVDSPREYKCGEHDEHDREIRKLRTEVEILQERERNLEIQLLEYYGLKEQETAVMELHNRLKLNNMEAKLYNLKIESLQSDNRRLEAKVSDYSKVVTELEAAKAKIKQLRKKLKSDAEQNRENILNLQERVMKLRDQETKAVENDRDVEMQLERKKELEKELEEMKKTNQALKQENFDLAQKMEYVQMLATSALDGEELQELHKESQRLRQQNEDLMKELEQHQADRCTDIEELVYIRWINACLRYELRNYQPAPGKTIARDLSRTLSPKSEERAKQLILKYANKEGSGDRGINISDFDSDQWSSSQASYLTDSGEGDDMSIDISSTDKTNPSGKPKVFAKLMRLFRGKDTSPSRLERAVSMDDIVGKYRSNSQSSNNSVVTDAAIDSFLKTSRNSSAGSSRHSLDLQRSYSRGMRSTPGGSSNCSGRTSDDGSLNIFRRIDSITEDDSEPASRFEPRQEAQREAKIELVKYAEALKNSRVRSSFRKRAASFST